MTTEHKERPPAKSVRVDLFVAISRHVAKGGGSGKWLIVDFDPSSATKDDDALEVVALEVDKYCRPHASEYYPQKQQCQGAVCDCKDSPQAFEAKQPDFGGTLDSAREWHKWHQAKADREAARINHFEFCDTARCTHEASNVACGCCAPDVRILSRRPLWRVRLIKTPSQEHALSFAWATLREAAEAFKAAAQAWQEASAAMDNARAKSAGIAVIHDRDATRVCFEFGRLGLKSDEQKLTLQVQMAQHGIRIQQGFYWDSFIVHPRDEKDEGELAARNRAWQEYIGLKKEYDHFKAQ